MTNLKNNKLMIFLSLISILLIVLSLVFPSGGTIYSALICITIIFILGLIKIDRRFKGTLKFAILALAILAICLFCWSNLFVNSVPNTAYLSDTDFRWSLLPLSIWSLFVCGALILFKLYPKHIQ